MRIAVAADHAGFPLKDPIIEHLRAAGHEPVDFGTDSTEAGLLVLRRFAPLDVRRFEGYTATGRPFLLLLTDDASGWNWVVPALEAERRSLRTVARADGMTLLEVT